jgi:hypothetical protein
VNPEPSANEADLLDQAREIGEAEEPEQPPVLDAEADPADVQEQSLPVPSEEEDRPNG